MSRFDYSKLASYIESIPPLSGEDVVRYLRIVLDHARAMYQDIDPRLEARDEFQLIDTAWVQLLDRGNLLVEIAEVIRTPRALKSALRRTMSAWRELHGEVDLTELLLVCILRESTRPFELRSVDRPNENAQQLHVTPKREETRADEFIEVRRETVGIFDVVNRQLRWLRERSQRESRTGPLSAEQALLERLIQENRAEGRIISELFPEHAERYQNSRPQGVVVANPTDYWARILSEAVGSETPDQIVLKEIARFHESSEVEIGSELVNWFKSPTFEAKKVLQFSRRIDSDDVLRLAWGTVRAIVSEYPHIHLDDRQHVEGFINVGRLLLWNNHSDEGRLAIIRDGMNAAMSKSLLLVHNLEYWLVFRPMRSFSRTTDSAEVRLGMAKFVQDCFVNTFVDAGPETLNRAVDYEYVLSFLIRRMWDTRDEYAPPEDPEGWSRAASPIVRAAESAPQRVGIALAIALTTSGRSRRESSREGVEEDDIREWFGSFDEEFATTMLREEFVPALRVFARLNADGLRGEILASVKIAKDYAIRYLAERGHADS